MEKTHSGASYRTAEDFKRSFSPSMCEEMAEGGAKAFYLADSPTLRQTRDLFGDVFVNEWLSSQLLHMLELAPVTMDKLTANSLLRTIRAGYPGMRVAEFMHFVFLYRMGEFGKSYGKADGQHIMLCLRDYSIKREEYIKEALRAEPAPASEPSPADARRGFSMCPRVLEEMISQELAGVGEWRSEPWAAVIARHHYVDTKESGKFPGDMTKEERRSLAEALGWEAQ